ncbi:MAG: carbohydrate ABC transporter permease [Chloroflexota bacterium]
MRASPREIAVNYTVLAILVVIVLYPMLGVLGLAFQSGVGRTGQLTFPPELTLDTLSRTWDEGRFDLALRSSAVVATSATVVTAVVSILAGYAFGVMRFPLSSALFYLILVGMIVPLESYVVPLYYEMRDLSLLDTWPGLVLALSASLLPFGVFWMRAQFKGTPKALIEAAQIDGANSWSVLRHVLLPLARPAIASLLVLTFLWAWNDFLLTLILVSSNELRTAQLQLGLFIGVRTSDTRALAAAALIVSIPVLLVYVVGQRSLIRGIFEGGVKE